MQIMILIILLILSILVLIFLWFYNRESHDDPNYPTIHSTCGENTTCGGDLVCDISSRRCKKKEGGDCAENIDCDYNLHCFNWKCVSNPTTVDYIDDTVSSEKKHEQLKNVHWNTKNDILIF